MMNLNTCWFSKQKPNNANQAAAAAEPVPADDLWDLVLDMHWDAVITHAEEYPYNAKYQDGHWDETPLYLACQFHPPANAISAIVRAYPEAVSIPSRENHDLPLHLSCRYQAPAEVLEELVREFPVTAVEQTRWGKTPLTVLWEFQPAALTEDYWRKVKILLHAVARFREDPRYLCQKPRNTGSKGFRRAMEGAQQCHETGTTDINQYSLSHAPVSSGTQYSLVHAAVSLGARCCPVQVLDYVMSQYPEEVHERDRWGQLPLHIVIGPTSWSHAGKRKYKPRELPFIQRLLRADPTAARERLLVGDERGRYPLHTALSNRHRWAGGVSEIFNAAPEVLQITDPITKLYPFQLAAVPVGETTVDLDTIYSLLRSDPTVLSFFDLDKEQKIQTNPRKLETEPADKKRRLHPVGLREALVGTVIATAVGFVANILVED